ncbi:hypothetical protein CL65_gp097 [Mycobacterium phage Patience]|uniref:Uncharacterized protein n=1 Tax=Mycobacterium phage Patience TaxID=1074308 RepID=G1JWL1_9CAUD|nr:hypothetical protein CL65_gp097 [Mycobacterium phage Patience]AEL98009.2 hypothetical protein PATIENCE_101 [Mycobacterium phage Patience]
MSKDKKNKNNKNFRPGRDRDSDETADHIRPVDKTRSVEAPAGQFVDVPRGMIAVPGAIVDEQGVLRRETGELAIWHHRCKFHGPCERYTDKTKFVQPEEVVDIAGSPWCPDCVDKMQEDAKRKKVHEMFREKLEEN